MLIWVPRPCKDTAMNLADARAAYEEATAPQHALSDDRARWLAEACRRRLYRLGDGGVLAHSVRYDPSQWPDLPARTGDGTWITRGDVFALADGHALKLVTASYVFGMGLRGYGPHRYGRVVSGALDLGGLLERVREI